MTAKDLLKLLAARHSDDLFVPECKNGPTHAAMPGDLLKLDAWAMARSWAHPKLTGYEIKVSRSDFLRDDKWRAALPLCNEFWWVAPPGIIDKSEVSPECGLLETSKNGSRLFTRKRPQYRDIEPPVDLFTYVLMCRVVMKDNLHESQIEYWRNWLAEKQERRDVGYRVSASLRKIVDEKINAVEKENRILRSGLDAFQKIIPVLEESKRVKKVASERGDVYVPVLYNWENVETVFRRNAMNCIPKGLVDSMRKSVALLDELCSRESP